jgi:hypothetical protein
MGLSLLVIMPDQEKKKKKQPTIKTLEDKGTKIDYVDFGDGKQAFFYQSEKFRGLGIGAFRLGWSDKYNIISPQKLTRDEIVAISGDASIVTGSTVRPEDFVVHLLIEKKPQEEKKQQ